MIFLLRHQQPSSDIPGWIKSVFLLPSGAIPGPGILPYPGVRKRLGHRTSAYMLLVDMNGAVSHNGRGEDIHPLLNPDRRASVRTSGVATYTGTPSGISTQTKISLDSSASSVSYTPTSIDQNSTTFTPTSTSSPTITSSSNKSDTTPSWISDHKLTLAGIIAAFLALAIAITFVIIVICRRARKRRTEEEKARQSFFAGTESAMFGATMKSKKTVSRCNSMNPSSALEMSRRGSGKRYWGGLGSDEDIEVERRRTPMPYSSNSPRFDAKGNGSAMGLTKKPSLKSSRTNVTAVSDPSGVERPPSVAPSIPPPPAPSPFTILTEAFKSGSDESHDYSEPNTSILRDVGPSNPRDPYLAGGILSDLKLGDGFDPPVRTPIRLYTPSTRSNVATIEGTGFPRPPPSPTQPTQITPVLKTISTSNTLSPLHSSFDTTSADSIPPPSINLNTKASSSTLKPSRAERKQNIRALENLIAALDDAASEGGSVSLTDTPLTQASSNSGARKPGPQSPLGTPLLDASMWRAALGPPTPNPD